MNDILATGVYILFVLAELWPGNNSTTNLDTIENWNIFIVQTTLGSSYKCHSNI